MRGKGQPTLAQVDIHVVTGALKLFLKSLKEQLITWTLWTCFTYVTDSIFIIFSLGKKKCISKLVHYYLQWKMKWMYTIKSTLFTPIFHSPIGTRWLILSSIRVSQYIDT